MRLATQPDTLVFPSRFRELIRAQARRTTHRPAPGLSRFSPLEQEVLRGMARGLSNAEIAAALFFGVETVKTHVGSILASLDVRDRTQAVVRAYESGFVTPEG